MTKKDVFLSLLCLCPIALSLFAEGFLGKAPCTLCQMQQFAWAFAFLFSLAKVFRSCSEKLEFEEKFKKLSLFMLRVSLICAFAFATLHGLVHLQLLPDFCVRGRPSDIASFQEMLPSVPCGENIFTALGVPAYALGMLFSIACFLLTFNLKPLGGFYGKPNRT